MNVIGYLRRLTSLALIGLLGVMPMAAQDQAPATNSQTAFTLKVDSDLVLTNIVVRDKKTGEVVRGLTAK